MLRFNSMPNFRQLAFSYDETDEGGEKGQIIRLYRSSRPDLLTSEEIAQFRSAGIRSIIDFRSVKEYGKANGLKLLDDLYPVYKIKVSSRSKCKPYDEVSCVPLKAYSVNSIPSSKENQCQNQNNPLGKHFLINFFQINYIWNVFNRAPWYIRLYSLLFLAYDLVFNTGYQKFVRIFARHVLNHEGLYGQYCDMVNYSQASICSALKLLTCPENLPAMLNCAHGKDRTGIMSALILSCLGKSKEEIVEDYAQSEMELALVQERIEQEIVGRYHMCRTFLGSKSETMMKLLEYLETNYGSISNYLESIGFTCKDQEQLRLLLTT